MAWVLIAGFLLQPVLAYLVTPLVTHDRQGQQVVVCTLQGTKLVTLDLPQPADNEDAEHCSALELYQLAGAAKTASPPQFPAAVLYAVGVVDERAEHQHRPLHVSIYSTRAPPALS